MWRLEDEKLWDGFSLTVNLQRFCCAHVLSKCSSMYINNNNNNNICNSYFLKLVSNHSYYTNMKGFSNHDAMQGQTPLNWTADILDSPLHHHPQNTIWISFGRTVFIPPVQFQELAELIPRHAEGVPGAHNGPTLVTTLRHVVVFLFHKTCHLSVDVGRRKRQITSTLLPKSNFKEENKNKATQWISFPSYSTS